MKIIRTALKLWLPLAAVITVLAGLVYLAVQQSYRMGANDPQIQMAEDAAAALAAGQAAQSIVPVGKIDIAQSLAPYLIVFDASGKPIASNAVLHGQTPDVPPGIIDYTRQHGEDRISWQPEAGVRSAAIIVAANGGQAGFVLAGRSMREVEKRIDQFGQLAALFWMLGMGAALGLVFLFEILRW
jgi:hypothetical protein